MHNFIRSSGTCNAVLTRRNLPMFMECTQSAKQQFWQAYMAMKKHVALQLRSLLSSRSWFPHRSWLGLTLLMCSPATALDAACKAP